MSETEHTLPADPPVHQIFDTLRKLWRNQGREAGEERRFQDLALLLSDHLGIHVTPQKLSQWSTASATDNRRPPWGAIYWLMASTGYDVTLTTDPPGAKLVRPTSPVFGEPAVGAATHAE